MGHDSAVVYSERDENASSVSAAVRLYSPAGSVRIVVQLLIAAISPSPTLALFLSSFPPPSSSSLPPLNFQNKTTYSPCSVGFPVTEFSLTPIHTSFPFSPSLTSV